MGNRGGEREEEDIGSSEVSRREDAGGSGSGRMPPVPEMHVMRWDSFLPKRSLRVLLVESDDSTRHIVTALLRKCNYRVAGVADGMKAWEVMKEKKYSFDLVLTEVAMPSLSGIGLLTKITGAEEFKNIPVIMMSTHDSVNVVLKCMLKGAVDFLVKPVRKNELRNLWQHVWRRHCSNRDMIMSDNNAVSNHASANFGGRSKNRESSDESSDAQSSGSKRDIEIETSQKYEEPPQVKDSYTTDPGAYAGTFDNDGIMMAMGSKTKAVGSAHMAGDTGVNVTLPVQETSVANVSQEHNGLSGSPGYREGSLALLSSAKCNKHDPKPHWQNNASNESVQNMAVFVEPIFNEQCSYAVCKKNALPEDELPETGKSSFVNDAPNMGTSPLWELALKRPHSNGFIQPELKEKHALKHSVASAFSRYREKKIHKSVSTDLCIERAHVEKFQSFVGSHGADDEKNTHVFHTDRRPVSLHGSDGETTAYIRVSSAHAENDTFPSPSAENECADHSSIMEDTLLRPQFSFIPLPIPIGPVPYQSLCAGFGGFLQPVFYPGASLAPHNLAAFEKSATQIPVTDRSLRHENQPIKHSSSLDFHHHEVAKSPCHWRQPMTFPESGDSRMLCSPMKQAYQSSACCEDVLKGTGCGCNGSDETADGIGGTALENRNVSGVQNCNRKFSDSDRSRREAALIKFRMKRKDRCFEKKVRYYSRQQLAEQRPRIKGQFVRQKVTDSITIAEGDKPTLSS